MFELLFLLIVIHFICDYPLQGEFLAKAKSKFNPTPGVPWYQALAAHSMIHAGGVYFVTQRLDIALFELVVHAIIDHNKCSGRLNYNTDQFLHIWCKLIYVGMIYFPIKLGIT